MKVIKVMKIMKMIKIMKIMKVILYDVFLSIILIAVLTFLKVGGVFDESNLIPALSGIQREGFGFLNLSLFNLINMSAGLIFYFCVWLLWKLSKGRLIALTPVFLGLANISSFIFLTIPSFVARNKNPFLKSFTEITEATLSSFKFSKLTKAWPLPYL
jgi:hypothetical protein